MRTKRSEKIMPDNCSSHQTGIALAYYSMMIKHYFNKLKNEI